MVEVLLFVIILQLISQNLKIKTLTFNDSSITCLANDYGYENWIQKAIDLHANKGDIIIFISSSGNSLNHLKGAKFCRKKIYIQFLTLVFTKINYLR